MRSDLAAVAPSGPSRASAVRLATGAAARVPPRARPARPATVVAGRAVVAAARGTPRRTSVASRPHGHTAHTTAGTPCTSSAAPPASSQTPALLPPLPHVLGAVPDHQVDHDPAATRGASAPEVDHDPAAGVDQCQAGAKDEEANRLARRLKWGEPGSSRLSRDSCDWDEFGVPLKGHPPIGQALHSPGSDTAKILRRVDSAT